MDEFDFAADPAVPLDIPTMPGAGAPPTQQPPTAGKDKGKGGMGQLAKMLPLIAAAMKQGGRPGVAAFLQGVQRAKAARQGQDQQTFQNDRLTANDQRMVANDQRLAANDQATESYRQQQLAGQAKERQIAFAQQMQEAIGSLDNPDAVRHYLELVGPQAEAMGIPRAALERYAMQTATPTRLQQTAAEKKLAAIQKQHGAKWTEEGQKFTYIMADSPTDPKTGQQVGVPFEELLRRAGQARDPNAPQAAAASKILPDVPLDRQHAAAVAAGDEPLAKTIESAMSRQDATRRDPARGVDPVLNEIRELTLANLKASQGNGEMSPGKFRQAQGLSDDYINNTKSFWVQRSAYQQVLSANPSQKSPAGHMALIFGYMKLLDPNSVVRETEYATAQNAAGVPDRVRNLYNKAIDGAILTPAQIVDFKDQARRIYMGAKRGAVQTKAIFDQRAAAQGLPPGAATYMLDDPTVSDDDAESGVVQSPPARRGGAGHVAPTGGVSYQDYLKSKGR